MPRLYRVILPVADIERAVAVYARLLRMDGERVAPGRHYFNCGGTVLVCYDPVVSGDAPAEVRYHPEQFIYIGVPDLGETLRDARALGFDVTGEGIYTRPWGERLFWSRDPWGNPVSFVDERTLYLGKDENALSR